MYKVVILLKRRDDMTAAAFKHWWLQQHAPLARQLPGLRQAVFNLVTGEDNPAFDGISELRFDSPGAFEQAYASDLGQRVAADSLAHVSQRIRLICDPHPVL